MRMDRWRKVLRRDPCAYCGFPAVPLNTIDHIRPQKHGHALTWANATSACSKCNARKGHASLLRFLWETRHVEEIERLTGRSMRDVAGRFRNKAWRHRPKRPEEIAMSAEQKAVRARGYGNEMARLLQVALEAQAAGQMGPQKLKKRAGGNSGRRS